MSRVAKLRELLSRAQALEQHIRQSTYELHALHAQAFTIGRLMVCSHPQCGRELFVPAEQKSWPSKWWASEYDERGELKFMCPECAQRLGCTAQLCLQCSKKVVHLERLRREGWHRLGLSRGQKRRAKASKRARRA